MILPNKPQTTAAVAAHYDELDLFYREIWGRHVHHGYWVTGDESVEAATEALIDLLAARLDLAPGQAVCDIGCGYGGTAAHLAGRHGVTVTGLTVSAAQAKAAVVPANVTIIQQDWLHNGLPDQSFDRAYSVESSEHMPDKQRFFDEAFRVLKPGGLLAVCAWLAADAPRLWEVRHLLEPICREGRLQGMGTVAEYCQAAERAGFVVERVDDLSGQVARTWRLCLQRGIGKIASDRRYRRFLLDRSATERIFAVTMLRLLVAYRVRAMRYGMLVLRKTSAAIG